MPEVPRDPFASRVSGKSQERLPQGMGHLPLGPQPSGATTPRPSMAELLMAAATMHQMNRLVDDGQAK